MNKIFFFFILCFLFLFLNLKLTKAVSPTGSILVNYRLLNDRKAKVEIDLDITNNYSDDLISEIQMRMFCSDIKLESDLNNSNLIVNEDGKSIKINLFDNPIYIGKSRNFNFSFFCKPGIDNVVNLKSLFIPELISDFKLNNFKMNIFYPEDWGKVAFLSNISAKEAIGKIVLDVDDNLFIQWQSSNSLGFEYDLHNVKIKENGLVPFLRKDDYQSIEFESFPDNLDLFQSLDGNLFFKADGNIEEKIKGNIIFLNNRNINYDINGKFLVPFFSVKDIQKIKVNVTDDKAQDLKSLADFLKKNFKFSSKHNIQNLEGDELDLALLLLSWLRSNGIRSDLNLGWYIGENEQGFTTWINWRDGENDYDFSILDYIRARSNVVDKIPVHIRFIRISDFKDWKMKDIRKIYENFIPIKLNEPYKLNKNLLGENDVQINIFWEDKYYFTEFALKGNLFIKNNTDAFVHIDEIVANNLKVNFKDDINVKNMKYLIAPGQKKDLEIILSSFDFNLLRTENIQTQIRYNLLDNPLIYRQDFNQSIEGEKIVFPFKIFIIIFFIIFLGILIIRKIEKIKEFL